MSRFVLPDALKHVIVADKAIGFSNQAIADKYKLHRNTVSRIITEARNVVRDSALTSDWKERLRFKSVRALDESLDCKEDPYKRGNLAARVLVGTGDFAGESTTNIVTLVSNKPGGWDELPPTVPQPLLPDPESM